MLTFSAGLFLPLDLKFCFSFFPSVQVPHSPSRQCCAQHPVQGLHWKAQLTQLLIEDESHARQQELALTQRQKRISNLSHDC